MLVVKDDDLVWTISKQHDDTIFTEIAANNKKNYKQQKSNRI
jgi:hypothetical protein